MDTLNLMANVDIFQKGYEEIKKIFKNYSISTVNKNRGVRNLNSYLSKIVTPSISRYELGTMLDDMKTSILHSLTLQLKMKNEEVEKAFIVFCPRRKEHEKDECPLDTIETYGICVDKYNIDK